MLHNKTNINKKPKLKSNAPYSYHRRGMYQPEYRFEYIFQWSGRSWQEIILHQKKKKKTSTLQFETDSPSYN